MVEVEDLAHTLLGDADGGVHVRGGKVDEPDQEIGGEELELLAGLPSRIDLARSRHRAIIPGPAPGPGAPFAGRPGGASPPAVRTRPTLLRLVFIAAALLCAPARASDTTELWPELNLYKSLGPTTRLYFVAAWAAGKESEFQTLDLAGYFDVTFRPFTRDLVGPEGWRSQADWRQRRYLWVRLGYDHVFKQQGEEMSTPEDRGIVAVHGRVYLPEGILLETRARADLRWIGGDYSTRYRFRGELNRDFEIRGRATNVWLQAEAFYDDRYDGWARELYQAGAEVTLGEHFRVEPSVARQVDRLPEKSGLWAVAIVARWFY